MRKILLFAAICLCGASIHSQTVIEPEFIGECMVLKPDQSTELLEKHLTQTRSSGVIITGFGSLKSKLQIDGCCSNTKLKSGNDIQFIVRAVDNNTDPMAIIKIFEFDSSKKFRRAELASVNSFGTTKTNKLHYLNFTGKKYGQNSYLITLKDKPVGEFGITVTNPNSLDEKSTVITTFSIL
ncbi:hypothetical protein CHRY9390_02055 [Chryseobacterium aquaeductus]|uniref:Uncharacterized protein n=1 Tax=Chryseobacterium aquaeductus TaxID=2675056 RepID=A0A9N8MIF3_9FLAO|nr:hypothetical protein [Chryseobacterium aquaeductus]CAA7331356.1 hypothetical protein CHRY9390_02055 [Chryseobacterium potabilaquae]CAD7809713.1 hypothetical protein CHRY9390_02055 [Chryseobacterium aquaeductus]